MWSFTQILVLQTLLTAMLSGLIWTVQLAHYPAFKYIDEKEFVAFQSFHMRAISYIVMPLMLMELAGSMALIFTAKSYFTLSLINFGFVVAIWLATFFLSVPEHNKLMQGKNIDTIHRLVNTNWPRTLLWSAKLALSSYMLFQVIE